MADALCDVEVILATLKTRFTRCKFARASHCRGCARRRFKQVQ